ncbi:AAA family ATPase [Chengkuizengella axinellae]|uniref:AAA family ATPase n=1 Tax=Chengkuizengella axinellae TaxID=3064388 RepID=A0ABT9J3M0_9BACL|nr:AAA family ATPase [Chengkuizengella sp. 2205SS18-9]MDP5276204.1 AAA family ATPase [Chengkuizengella sp. 2205SS18-9]
MSKYEVNESVWLATAIMAYETYYNTTNPNREMMYFKQKDIQNKALELCKQNVNSARISQWFNADHTKNTFNYLREGDNSSRRLSFQGEFGGIKEVPDLNQSDIVNTNLGPKQIKEIQDFITKEYTLMFTGGNVQISTNDIKCISILDYLDEYGGQAYQDPKKADPSRKPVLLKLKAAGGAAVDELDKMVDLCEKRFGLKRYGKRKWLNGGGNKARKYLWRQMKMKGQEDCPTSLSLFAEIVEGKARFKFSVELDEKQSKDEDYIKHHRLLNKDISEASDDLIYIASKKEMKTDLTLSTKEVKQLIDDGIYRKIQIARIITRDHIETKFHDDKGIINGMLNAVNALIPYYELVLGEGTETTKYPSNDGMESNIREGKLNMLESNKNMILYGPPGTGKTYNTVIYAVAIIEKKSIDEVNQELYSSVFERYKKYKADGKIAFTTFHQSYGYEEFIEGIKPKLTSHDDEDTENLEYKIESGSFKKFCDKAKQIKVKSTSLGINSSPTIWKVSLKSSGINEIKDDCFKNNRIRIDWANRDKVLTDKSVFHSNKEKGILMYFQDEMKVGDIVLTLLDQEHIDGIGIVTGGAEWLDDVDQYPRSRSVQWIATGIKENIVNINQGTKLTSSTVYRLDKIDQTEMNKLINKHLNNQDVVVEENKENYVFIIDEINRGNISKIFGELITLIESTKRLGKPEATTARLPYSGTDFGVPNNVFIIGTMNTADRSIALMDTALRRRFKFIEIMPNEEVLEGIKVGEIDIMRMLKTINARIEFLFDREHTIGHAYFVSLAKEPTLETLADIFQNSILPLMQEYFYEDYSKIQLVLGDNEKDEDFKFIKDEALKIKEIFKGNPDVDFPEKKFSVQNDAFYKEESYIKIYE